MPDDPRAIARGLTTAQAYALGLAAGNEFLSVKGKARPDIIELAAQGILRIVGGDPHDITDFKITALGRAVAAALREDGDGS